MHAAKQRAEAKCMLAVYEIAILTLSWRCWRTEYVSALFLAVNYRLFLPELHSSSNLTGTSLRLADWFSLTSAFQSKHYLLSRGIGELSIPNSYVLLSDSKTKTRGTQAEKLIS
ncbi:hypothetical protein AVEN_30443-1 [Araneus ventricosus]|uniref:Uncharacterized protein n=1 Tax=Araneus ventricosus TaxID=182803 RepID=A0A4Y2JMD9_ARAVE|nr:hypothetical protein AVEN_30443-1 [Araneus ventricosus]